MGNQQKLATAAAATAAESASQVWKSSSGGIIEQKKKELSELCLSCPPACRESFFHSKSKSGKNSTVIKTMRRLNYEYTHTLCCSSWGKSWGSARFNLNLHCATQTHLTHADADHISRLLCTTHTRQVSFYSKWLLSDQNVTKRKGKREIKRGLPTKAE